MYNETAFRGLDYILYQASLNGIRVLFTLADNWKTQDSKVNVRPPSPLLPSAALGFLELLIFERLDCMCLSMQADGRTVKPRACVNLKWLVCLVK